MKIVIITYFSFLYIEFLSIGLGLGVEGALEEAAEHNMAALSLKET